MTWTNARYRSHSLNTVLAGAHRQAIILLRYHPVSGVFFVNQILSNSLRIGPDYRGRLGKFGGRLVGGTLMPNFVDV